MALTDSIFKRKATRRNFLRGAALAGMGLAYRALDDTYFRESEALKPFSPDQLGVSINARSIRSFDLDIEKTLDQLLALPGKHVRIPVPFNEVEGRRGRFNFSSVDRIVEKALHADKLIDIQFGAKTFGFPEVHVPNWLTERYPYLNSSGVVLDREPVVQDYILEYLDRSAARYLPIESVKSIHVENEGLLRHLDVARGRYVSLEFNKREIELVKSHDSYDRPVVQNIAVTHPLDFDKLPRIMETCQTVALNIYNQYNHTFFPNSWHKWWLWTNVDAAFQAARLWNKDVIVSEYQTSEWIDKNRKYHFDWQTFLDGLVNLQKRQPKVVYLWDVEQVLWRAATENSEGDFERIGALTYQ
jgi:hypothetical protein